MAGRFPKILGIFYVCISLILEASYSQRQASENWYQQGIELQEQGEYQAALDLWLEAKNNLQQPSFKIGQAFIELAAQQQMKAYYKEASAMYLWGLETSRIDSSKEALLNEVEYMNALFSLKRFKELKNKVEDSDRSVLGDLRTFWKKNDPTPLTPYNERLIEHWKRIAYSFEHFSKPNSRELDDRADLYIRYGKPDYTRKGKLNYNSGTVNFLLDQRMTGRLDPFEADDAFYREAMKTMQFNLEARIRNLHEYPRYDIWIYENLDNKPDHAIFLFGSSDGVVYRKKNSVEDFIPSMAFNKSHNSEQSLFMQQQTRYADNQNQSQQARIPDVDITPALIMQLMYYRQFSALDRYFGDAFNKMITRYEDITTRIPVSLAREFESINTGELVRLQYQVPRQSSSQQRELASIPVNFYMYRFINEQDQPYYKVFVTGDVAQVGQLDFLKKENRISNAMWDNYLLSAGAQLLDEQERALATKKRNIPLNSVNADNISTVFDIVQHKDRDKIRAAVQLFDSTEAEQEIAEESVFDAGTIAIGEATKDLPDPLQVNGLEMGDVILGYGSATQNSGSEIPFRIAHDRILPEGQPLNLYYEIYNLSPGTTGQSNFLFTYEIQAVSKFLFIPKTENSDLTITTRNEINDTRFSNSLEIKTTQLEPGKYKLQITVQDLETGDEIERTVDFEIK